MRGQAVAARSRKFAVEKEEVSVPGPEGDPDIAVVSFRTAQTRFPDRAVLWLHGGGFWASSAHDLPPAVDYCPNQRTLSFIDSLAATVFCCRTGASGRRPSHLADMTNW